MRMRSTIHQCVDKKEETMFDKIRNKSMIGTVIVAALCGFVSTVSAVNAKQLDVDPGTPTPNYIPNVSDSQGSDYVNTNMFVGNFFGYECALTDAIATYSGAPSFKASIGLRCSNNQFYSTGPTTYPNMQNGAEVGVFCPAFTTAQASVHYIWAVP